MKSASTWIMIAAGAVAAAVVGAAAIAQTRPMPPAVPQGPSAAFEGPTWRLVGLRGFDAAALPGGPRSVTARFQGGRIDGFSGCNRYFGAYEFRQGRLAIGSLAGSMMACQPAAMALESAVQRALSGSFRPLRDDDRLSLLSDAGEPVLVFKAEPAPSLAGLRSNITGFNNGRQAVVSPQLGTTLSLSFGDGVVKGFGGCNTFRATYTTQGNQIAVGPVASTRRACPGEGVMQQEREFIAALKSTTTWAFSGALLDMHRADGERTLSGSREE
jgi:heat shock protein HslJ